MASWILSQPWAYVVYLQMKTIARCSLATFDTFILLYYFIYANLVVFCCYSRYLSIYDVLWVCLDISWTLFSCYIHFVSFMTIYIYIYLGLLMMVGLDRILLTLWWIVTFDFIIYLFFSYTLFHEVRLFKCVQITCSMFQEFSRLLIVKWNLVLRMIGLDLRLIEWFLDLVESIKYVHVIIILSKNC